MNFTMGRLYGTIMLRRKRYEYTGGFGDEQGTGT